MQPLQVTFRDIESKIYLVRSRKVILDVDLAELYEVTTFNLNKAVQRNLGRFPPDFMFRLNETEAEPLKFHIGMSKIEGRGGRRTLPFAFTQEGVAMLSSVLRNQRAIEINITIMRVFVHLRELMISHKDLEVKLDALEKNYDGKFKIVFEALHELISERAIPLKKIHGLGKPPN